MKIIVATQNPKKFREIQELLMKGIPRGLLPACAGHGRQATGLPHKSPLSLKEERVRHKSPLSLKGERVRVRGGLNGFSLGFHLQVVSLKEWEGKIEEVIEDGKSFWENAVKKAMAIAHQTPDWVLADDSGLDVDALDGAPGVFSARFAAAGTGLKPTPADQENNQKLLQLLKDVPLERRTARFRCSVAIAHEKKLLVVVEGKCEGTIAFSLSGHYGFGYDPLFIPAGYQKTFAELGPEIKHKISHRSQALNKAKNFILESVGKFPERSSGRG